MTTPVDPDASEPATRLSADALIVSGPLTQPLGSALGLGPAAVLAWCIAKWPILLLVVLVIVATLYYATPNVKQTKFRWLSIGALVAILIRALSSVAFGSRVSRRLQVDMARRMAVELPGTARDSFAHMIAWQSAHWSYG